MKHPRIPRCCKDNAINSNGRLLIDFLHQTGLRIANGRVGVDADIGAYTFVGSNGSSVVDYCIVDEILLSKFVTFEICPPNIMSDHCLIEFSLVGCDMNRSSSNNNIKSGNNNDNKMKKQE